MNRASFFFTVLSLWALASCTTTSQVSLDYVAGVGHIRPGSAEFVTRSFVDRRDMGTHHLGTVRTQIGTPLEHIQTRVPVADVVTNAFGYGLQGRGMLSARSAARYIVTGEVLDLHCQLLVHPYGYAKIQVSIVEAASGRIIHTGTYEGERQSKAYIPGSGTPVPMLQDLTSGALQDAVDRALDDPNMRARVSQRPTETSGWMPGMI